MNPKLKSENYQNFGGLNTKYSPYVITPMEFLGLVNYDFQTPGSLAQRWGSTQYIGQTLAGEVKSLFEYVKLSGSSMIVTSHSGGIWSGATTGNLQGLSLTNFGTTLSVPAGVAPKFVAFFGNTLTGIQFGGTPYKGISNLIVGVTTTLFIDTKSQSENKLSMVTINDYLFAADGTKFFKYNGITTSSIGSIPAILYGLGASYVLQNPSPTDIGFNVGASIGQYIMYASTVNSRGFESQIWPIMSSASQSATAAAGSFMITTTPIILPKDGDVTSINVYSYFITGFSNIIPFLDAALWNYPYGFVANYPVASLTIASSAGITYVLPPMGSTSGGQTFLMSNSGAFPNPNVNLYQSLGYTTVIDGNYITSVQFKNYPPKYLELFSNRLFSAGFSGAPSTVWFSDTQEPEGYQPTFNFEVRTNDGDVITAMRSFATRLIIFKKFSFHVLSGDTPNNFYLQLMSDQYGCLNHFATAIYEQNLLFLDRKGVVKFNGSNIEYISNKVQPYFDRMNLNAAYNTAIMSHDKIRNQILLAIPIDGSSTNNLTLVYDYILNAWTTYSGYNPSAFANIQGYNITKYPAFGDYQGRINWSGPSMATDNGVGMTLYLKARFLHDMGDSVQKQFRRLYINSNPPGTTLAMPTNFYQDYGASIVYGTTFYLGSFQNRLEFGISAKSLSFEIYTIGATFFKLHGFTIEERMQRRV